jgi:hypothetical protein
MDNKQKIVKQFVKRSTQKSGNQGNASSKTFREEIKRPKRINLADQDKALLKVGSVRGNERWSNFGKGDKAKPAVSYQIPPEQLSEFLSSGLTPAEFLAQPGQAIANHSAPTLELKKRKPSGSVYRPNPVEATPRNQLERNVIEAYCKQVKGVTEVPTGAGRIDFLTESELIEFKLAHNWKHALGQLLVYGFYYPNHDLVLILVGSQSKYYCQEAKKHCSRFGVTVRQASK